MAKKQKSKTYKNKLLRLYVQQEKINELDKLYQNIRLKLGSKKTSYSSGLKNIISLNQQIKPTKLSSKELAMVIEQNTRFLEQFATKYKLSNIMKQGYTAANAMNELLVYLNEKYEGDVPFDNLNIEENFINWVKENELVFTEQQLINIVNKMIFPVDIKNNIVGELLQWYDQQHKLRK